MIKKIASIIIFIVLTKICYGSTTCPQDHFLIGCNPDGINGTSDDNKLFVNCTQKYRHSDPENNSAATWLNWHYPLYYQPRYDRYQIGEPGFDVVDSTDPNRRLSGTANIDYRIIVECVSITPGFKAVDTDVIGITLDEAGDSFNHSMLSDTHIHFQYRAPASTGGTELQWITFIIYDELGKYEASEPFSIIFGADPFAGDLVIDGKVDLNDVAELSYYWLESSGDKINDYYERADVNRDGKVNFQDFALLAENYLK
jgi:hypothetical protein